MENCAPSTSDDADTRQATGVATPPTPGPHCEEDRSGRAFGGSIAAAMVGCRILLVDVCCNKVANDLCVNTWVGCVQTRLDVDGCLCENSFGLMVGIWGLIDWLCFFGTFQLYAHFIKKKSNFICLF